MFHGVASAPIIHMARAVWLGGSSDGSLRRCGTYKPPSFEGRPAIGDVSSVLHGFEIGTYPPTLGERRHRSLARRLIAVCRGFNVAVVTARPVSCPKNEGTTGDIGHTCWNRSRTQFPHE